LKAADEFGFVYSHSNTIFTVFTIEFGLNKYYSNNYYEAEGEVR